MLCDTARLYQAHLGAGELQRTRLTFLQQPLVKGLTPPRNLPVTCGKEALQLTWVGMDLGGLRASPKSGCIEFVQIPQDNLHGWRYFPFSQPVSAFNHP